MDESGGYESWYKSVPWESLTQRDFTMFTQVLARNTDKDATEYWNNANIPSVQPEQLPGYEHFPGRTKSALMIGQLSADLLGELIPRVSIVPREERPVSVVDVSTFKTEFRSPKAAELIRRFTRQVVLMSDMYLKGGSLPPIDAPWQKIVEGESIELFRGIEPNDFQTRYDLFEFSRYVRVLIGKTRGSQQEGSLPLQFASSLNNAILDAAETGRFPQSNEQKWAEYYKNQKALEGRRKQFGLGEDADTYTQTRIGHKGKYSRQPDPGKLSSKF